MANASFYLGEERPRRTGEGEEPERCLPTFVEDRRRAWEMIGPAPMPLCPRPASPPPPKEQDDLFVRCRMGIFSL